MWTRQRRPVKVCRMMNLRGRKRVEDYVVEEAKKALEMQQSSEGNGRAGGRGCVFKDKASRGRLRDGRKEGER